MKNIVVFLCFDLLCCLFLMSCIFTSSGESLAATSKTALTFVDSLPDEESGFISIIETMPRFPGCEDIEGTDNDKKKCADKKMLEFIYSNIKYPPRMRDICIEGFVVVNFIVNKDGHLSDFKIVRDIGGGLGKEALRVAKSMPNWIPATQGGKLVKVQMNLPIRFGLQD